MMKIVQLNCVCGILSTGRTTLEFAQASEKKGDATAVFYSEGASNYAHAHRYISNIQRNIHAVLSRVSGLQGYWSRRNTHQLIKKIAQTHPDIIHLRVLHGNCLHFPALFEYLHREQLPTVITLHDLWWLTGRCAHPLVYQCARYQDGCGHCPASKDVCPSWFFDRSNKMWADKRQWLLGLEHLAVVGVSQWATDMARQSFLPEDKIHQIYNGIDTNVFFPREASALKMRYGIEGKQVLLGVSSTWTENKGLKDLLHLALVLPEEYQLVLVGSLSKSVTLPNNILHIEHTHSEEELAQWYSAADVFINPSLFETFGKTIVEAMACGTPAVVYNTTASPELIGDGCGRVVPREQKVAGLWAAIQELGTGDEKQTARCRQHVMDHFDSNACFEKYYALYGALLQQRRAQMR